MPVVMVEMWEGRSIEERRQLVKDLTDAFVKIGVPAKAVTVIVREDPRSCWAEGGQLCTDFEIPPGS